MTGRLGEGEAPLMTLAWATRRLLISVSAAVALVCAAPALAGADPVIAGAGDIACGTGDPAYNGGLGTATACRQKFTSDLLVSGGYSAVLTLGDNMYGGGSSNFQSLSDFQQAYDPTWGRVKSITYPELGEHEGTSGSVYCTYFGAVAHCNSSGTQAGAGFYSWDIGAWHVVAINSNCSAVGGCDVGSPHYTWLQNDLAAHPAQCTLAYWAAPRFSSGHGGSNTFMQPIWQLLYDGGADVVLSGHSHDYERFAPMDGSGNLNRADGMRQFVVGTGGAFFTGFVSVAPNSEVRNNSTFGVLSLTLHQTSYDWRFVPEAGKTFTDSGSQACRGLVGGGGAPGVVTPPPGEPSGPPPGINHPGSSEVSTARIRVLLARALAVRGKGAKLGALRKHGYSFFFAAPSAGRLVIGWYYTPKHGKKISVGTARVTVRKTGTVRIKLSLTRRGRRLLKHARKVKLTVKGSFTPAGQGTTSVTRVLRLEV